MDDQTIARFWSKVDRRGPGDCWLWTAVHRDPFGHGRMKIHSRLWVASRIAWTIANGPIPEGLCVLHKCDVPQCCNPAHLEIGTKRKNALDMHARGRAARAVGSKNGMAKLTEADVVEIRQSRETRDVLAARYGVTKNSITRLKHSGRWGHLPTETVPSSRAISRARVLTVDQAAAIRANPDGLSNRAMAAQFGVSAALISLIRKGHRYTVYS